MRSSPRSPPQVSVPEPSPPRQASATGQEPSQGTLRVTSSSFLTSSSLGSDQESGVLKARRNSTVSGLMGFSDSGDAESFRAEAAANRVRIRSLSRGTLNPRSRFVKAWDLVLILALLFTTFVTPFEIAFLESAAGASMAAADLVRFSLNRLIDGIFAVDICFTFLLPFRTSQKDGGMMVYDKRRIIKHYLRGWFCFDLLTCIPFDLIIGTIRGGSSDARLVGALRVLRIMKLARIIRASRIIDRWKDHISLSYALVSLLNFTFLTVVLAHWMACLWVRSRSCT